MRSGSFKTGSTARHSCFFQRHEGGEWRAVDPVLKDPERIYK